MIVRAPPALANIAIARRSVSRIPGLLGLSSNTAFVFTRIAAANAAVSRWSAWSNKENGFRQVHLSAYRLHTFLCLILAIQDNGRWITAWRLCHEAVNLP